MNNIISTSIVSSIVSGLLVLAPVAKAEHHDGDNAKIEKADKKTDKKAKKGKKMSCDCGDCEKNKCAEKKCEHCNHDEGHDHGKKEEEKKN
jgi:hypothetical protein